MRSPASADQPVQPRRFQEMYRHYQGDFPSTVRTMCKSVSADARRDVVPLAVRQAGDHDHGRPARGDRRAFDGLHGGCCETPKASEWSANIPAAGRRPEGVEKRSTCCSPQRAVMLVGQGVRYGGAADELRQARRALQIPCCVRAGSVARLNHPLALACRARRALPGQSRNAAGDVLARARRSYDAQPRARGSPAIPSRSRRPG